MAPVSPHDQTPVSRAPSYRSVALGALLGAAIWAGIVLLGIGTLVDNNAGERIPLAALAGAGAAWVARRRTIPSWLRVAPWGLLAVETLAVAVLAYTPLVNTLVPYMIRRDPWRGAPVDAVAVLSTWVTADGDLLPSAVDRLLSGLHLVRATGTRWLLLSQIEAWHGPVRLTSDADQQRLVSLLGAQAPRTLLVTDVYSTRDEAVKMRAVADRAGIRRIALVTSPLHSRRACAAFERVGFQVACVPSVSRDVPFRFLRRPTARLRAFRYWLHEALGMALYRARGWI